MNKPYHLLRLIIVLILFSSKNVTAQYGFSPYFIDSLNHPSTSQEVFISKELPTGNFVFTGRLWDLREDFIILTDKDGKTLARLSLPESEFSVFTKNNLASIVLKEDSLIFAQSCLTKPDSIPAIIYYVTDANLNLGRYGYWHMQTGAGQRFNPFEHLSAVLSPHPDGGYYALLPAYVRQPLVPTMNGLRTFFRINENLNEIRSRTVSTKSERSASNLMYDEKSQIYFSGSLDGTTLLLDSDFNTIKSLPQSVFSSDQKNILYSRNTVKKTSTGYLLTGTFFTNVIIYPNKPIDSAEYAYSYIMVKHLDSDFNVKDSTCIRPLPSDSGMQFGLWGWDKFGVVFQGLDFQHEDSLYFAYFNGDSASKLAPGNYTLFMTDSTLKTRWAKKVEMNRTIELRNITATRDGGCLVTGVLKDYKGGPTFNVDMYIAKHNATGERVWVKTFSKPMSDLHVYPNPASNELTIELPENTKAATIRIRDLNGRIISIYTTQQATKQVCIPIQLEVGTYFTEVLSDENVLACTKVIIIK